MQFLNIVPRIIFPRNFDFSKATADSMLMTNNIITKILNAIKGIKKISFKNKLFSKKNEHAAINLHSKSMDWFLYDRDLRHEKTKHSQRFLQIQ